MKRTAEATLAAIAEKLETLEESPLFDYRRDSGYAPVVGEGDPQADIMLIGEAPGAEEAKTGRPFVGAAGRVLDELLDSVSLERDQVYITNVVKDRPPGNRDPRASEIAVYAPFLRRQIGVIQPSLIAPLGGVATKFILRQFGLSERGARISDLHGRVLFAGAAYGQVAIVPLYHPAAVFYNRKLRDIMEADFQVLRRFA